MPIQSRATIKNNFRQYERPEQADYHNWIDSFVHKNGEDNLTINENGHVGIGTATPERALHILGTGGISDDVILDSRGNTNSGAFVFYKSRAEDAPVLEGDSLGLISWRGYSGTNMIQSSAIQAFSGSSPGRGNLRFYTRSEAMRIDENGNVGIGVTNPEAKLDINGAIHFSRHEEGTLLYYSTRKSGSPAGSNDGFRLRFDNNFFGPSRDGVVFEKTDTNQADPDGGFAFVNTGSDGTPETAMVILGNGNVGIGVTDPQAKLHIDGPIILGRALTVEGFTTINGFCSFNALTTFTASQITVDGNLRVNGRIINPTGRIVTPSDSRIKKEVKEFEEGLEILKKFRPVTFQYNGKGDTPTGDETYHGFIAQEVEKICPYMVSKYKAKLNDDDEQETELLSLNTSALEYLMVNAIVELDKRIIQLENK